MIKIRSGYVRPLALAGWERIDDTARPDIARIWSVVFPWSGLRGGGGDFVKLGEAVATAATTTLTVSGLAIPASSVVVLSGVLVGVAAGPWGAHLRINGEPDSLDWNAIRIFQDGTALGSGAGVDVSYLVYVDTGRQHASFEAVMAVGPGGKVLVTGREVDWGGVDVRTFAVRGLMKNTEVGSVTRIDLVSDVAGNIAAGSFFRVYRMM